MFASFTNCKLLQNNSFDNSLYYQTAPVTRASSQQRVDQNSSFLMPDGTMGWDHAYKYSHNAPNLGGRNLISALKNVAKNNVSELSSIPSLLQEVRVKQLKL